MEPPPPPPSGCDTIDDIAGSWTRVLELEREERRATVDGDIDRAAALHVERRVLRARLVRATLGERADSYLDDRSRE